jgi:hypothetical protein
MEWILAWSHVIFLIPLCFGMMLVFGTAFGMVGDADLELDADLDLDGDIDASSDVDHDHAMPEGHVESLEPSLTMRALSLLGVGRVPISVVMMTMSFLFGGVGLALCFFFEPVLGAGDIAGILAVSGAFITMFVGTGTVSRVVARLMPTTETYVLGKRALEGRIGKVPHEVTTERGFLLISDVRGDIHEVKCRTREGSIEGGTHVLVVQYVREGDHYIVQPAEDVLALVAG